MDFTLALTHFCEAHGPKSVLCTQVLPLECALCLPSSTSRSRRSSHASVNHVQPSQKTSHNQNTLSFREHGLSGQTNEQEEFSLMSPSIEQHPLYRRTDLAKDLDPQFRYGRAQGETCASCSFTVPSAVAAKLPHGAPGSLKDDGKTKNGAPVLRSREFVCLGDVGRRFNHEEHSSSQESNASSIRSDTSSTSHVDCHDHTLTYLTAKSPDNPKNYAQLRASVIRALSCEVLPRGMSEGPLCFGDSSTGYTIAYVFRLTDPKARGRRRAYAFVALAGQDANRAFKACPMLWEAFAAMAKSIDDAAQRQEEQERKDADDKKGQARNYTPVSSFLTQRPTHPDGQPRRAGQTQPRSLAEIIGDENIFTILHQYFVAVLRCLGDKFGGVPLSEDCSVYQTLADEEGLSEKKLPHRVQADLVAHVDRSDNRTPTPRSAEEDIEVFKTRLNKHVKQKSQCAPLTVDAANNRQVVA